MRLLLFGSVITLACDLLAQCPKCDTCYLKYPIRPAGGPLTFYPPLPEELFLRTPSLDTTAISNEFTHQPASIMMAYDTAAKIGYTIINYGGTVSGSFTLRNVIDVRDDDSCPCYEMVAEGVVMNQRDVVEGYWNEGSEENYIISSWTGGHPNGLTKNVIGGVTKDSGYYDHGKQIGTWITTANNDAKEIVQFDSSGEWIRRTIYWSYHTTKLKYDMRQSIGQFVVKQDSVGNKKVFRSEIVRQTYDTNGRIYSLTHYYSRDSTMSSYIDYYQMFDSSGNIILHAFTNNGITTVSSYYANGHIESIKYYDDWWVYHDSFYGNKIGIHVYYNPDGSVHHRRDFR